MEEREYLIELYEEYKKLLTEKQRKYFESYYFEDLSLNEIGEFYKVTKSLVGKTIKSVENKLLSYEEILKNNEKNKMLTNLINNAPRDLKTKLEEILYK